MNAIAASPPHPREIQIAVVASVLLHGLLIAASVADLSGLLARVKPPQELIVEVVTLPSPEPPPIRAAAEPPDRSPPIVLGPPPAPPQLEEAPIADRSRPTPSAGQHGEAAPRADGADPTPQPRRARLRPQPRMTEGRADIELPPRLDAPVLVDRSPPSLGSGARRGGSTEARQQSEGDFVLAQIMPHWLIDVRSPRFRDVQLGGMFELLADGTLNFPYGKHDRWDPERMIRNYGQMQGPRAEAVRVAIESFLRASRAAQPFRLPPGITGTYPRQIRIVFQLGDL